MTASPALHAESPIFFVFLAANSGEALSRDDSILRFDSTGVTVLVSGLKRLHDGGGDMALESPNASAMKVLEIIGLTSFFTVRSEAASDATANGDQICPLEDTLMPELRAAGPRLRRPDRNAAGPSAARQRERFRHRGFPFRPFREGGRQPTLKDRLLLEASIELAPEPTALRVARRFVGETLTDWGLEPVCDDARLITSELSTNAMFHARTDFRVTLRSGGRGHLRIEVRDGAGSMPTPVTPSQEATSGRGLVLVDDLATSWGTRVDGDGKVVWAEVHSTARAAAERPDLTPLALEDK